MSATPPTASLTEAEDSFFDGTLESEISPKLVAGDIEFDPIVVTRLGGTLPWNTDSAQLQCGETLTDTNGDSNTRVVFHCVATRSQFADLLQMRDSPEQINLISDIPYPLQVNFDQLKFDRVPDANGAIIRGEGSTDEPIYEIQLQSKENTDTNS